MKQFIITPHQIFITWRRFPATYLSCLLFCSFGIQSIHFPGSINAELFLTMAFLASVLSTVTQLFFESTSIESIFLRYLIPLSCVVLLTTALYHFPAPIHLISYAAFIIAALTLVPIAPFIKDGAHRDKIFSFSFILARQVLLAFMISGIIFAGLIVIVLSINLLFDVKYPRLLPDIALIDASLLFSILTLIGVPYDFKRDDLVVGVHFVTALIGYLVIPLLIFYGGILYWYFLNLCITQSLPKGVIVYMTTGFGILGILVHLALDHSNVPKMATSRFFHQYFFLSLLVPIFLMAFAIMIRIAEHGLSPARFVVVMICLWLFITAIFSFTRARGRLSFFIYLSAASLSLLTPLTLCFI